MNIDLLFIYGSLLSSENEYGRYLKHNAHIIAPAVLKGRLYNCGNYPGAISDFTGYNIKGYICRLNNVNEVLPILDDYEGFGDDQEQPNLFLRKSLTVVSKNEPINCWVYVYNLPVSGLEKITSGDYSAYLAS